MAFCKYCGRKLEEGETCSCQGQAAPASQPAFQGGQLALTVWANFLHIWKSPAENGQDYVQNGGLLTAAMLLLFHGICSGLFAVLCIGKINGLIGLGGSLTERMKFSSAGAFFLTVLYSLILSVLLTVILFLGNKLLRGEGGIQEMLRIASMRAAISIPVTLIGCLVFLLNVPAGIVIYYCAGALAGTGFLAAGVEGIAGLNRDRKIYLLVGGMILFAVVFLLFALWVFPSYIPSNVRELFSWDNLVSSIASY
ncbi:MAG TPA: hypothetical protein IAB44_13995 [Candidatus Limivivens intestinipullorum]|uniref:Yip1 domain-containing protein n=1 Tax=Candidatus Limivivens intestinipullorum TaxID=2840858 RepID=A0A9D1EUR1_9FIRM|nr:hypothetical protein [Candidatus Limivivens intestinipullorum]